MYIYFDMAVLVWNIGQLYEYRYSGKISTGVNGISPKLAGGSISGRLLVQVIDDNTINLAVGKHNINQ